MCRLTTDVRVATLAALIEPNPIGPRIQPGVPLGPTFGLPFV